MAAEAAEAVQISARERQCKEMLVVADELAQLLVENRACSRGVKQVPLGNFPI
jgi:hypothetical protein